MISSFHALRHNVNMIVWFVFLVFHENWPELRVVVMKCDRVMNKKVLLRERKRHTDRGVSSTPPEVGYPPAGYPRPGPTGGYPSWGMPRQGYPPAGPGWGTPQVWTDRMMDRHVSKHYLPVVLRTRSVMMWWCDFVFSDVRAPVGEPMPCAGLHTHRFPKQVRK